MTIIKDRLYAIAAQNRMPLSCALELSPICNFKCRMCYVRKSPEETRKEGGLLPLEFWLQVVEQLRDAGMIFPLLTGGEPLLYPDFWPLYETICRMGMHVSINSNASLVDENAVERFLKNPPERINITLYGGSNESYARLCGAPHGFDQVSRAVRLLHQHGIRFRFNCSLTPDNCADVEAMLAFAREYDQGVRFATYMFPPVRRTGQCGDYEARFTPQQAAYYHVWTDWLQSPPEQFYLLASHMQHYRELTDELIAEAAGGAPGAMRCQAGLTCGWVDWKGFLSACGIFTHIAVSLLEHSFTDAWQQVTSWAKEPHYSAVCANCVNAGVCYCCPAKVYNETGSFVGRPTYICEMRKYEKQYYAEFLQRLGPSSLQEKSTKVEKKPDFSCEMEI